MTPTPVTAATPLGPADAARLWLAHAHADPAAWEVALFVRHDQTDGVVVYGETRYDILSRERAAAGLAAAHPPHLFAALTLAAGHGPSATAFPRFPTGLSALLDTAGRFAAGPRRFHRTADGIALWKPLI